MVAKDNTLRVLQVIPDTDDNPASLTALRVHENLQIHGVACRTLALGPGTGRVVSARVPAMGHSSGSIASLMQLRRESRWADVVLFVDCFPRSIGPLFRCELPSVVYMSGPKSVDLVSRVARSGSNVMAIGTPTEEIAAQARSALAAITRSRNVVARETPVRVLAPPFDAKLRSESYRTHARAAAREQLGLEPSSVAITTMTENASIGDVISQRGATIKDPTTGPDRVDGATSILARLEMIGEEDPELVKFAADIVLVADDQIDPSKRFKPLELLDMMALGVVPVVVDGSCDVEGLVAQLITVVGDCESLGQAAGIVREETHHRHDPDEVHRQWSECLTQALPSQT